ncbi:hypothetical protein N9K26_01395 [Flavobacteriales bacterium]|nr:hypothetical protein [Flavobacteriales bacterium]
MKFIEARESLFQIFEENSFRENVVAKNLHCSESILATCSNGTEISVSYPGYKSKLKGNKIVYDFRVDIKKDGIKTALSHANIITDIYNKIVNGGMNANNLRNRLIKSSVENMFNLGEVVKELTYNPCPPNQDLIAKVNYAHGVKQNNIIGNSFDLTIEELFTSIKWIVLQEDINYPISSGFEGRKMPFARYLEAIYTTESNERTLESVIKRALAHYRPNLWKDMDYSFRKNIH